jgi:hypothetical protein
VLRSGARVVGSRVSGWLVEQAGGCSFRSFLVSERV